MIYDHKTLTVQVTGAALTLPGCGNESQELFHHQNFLLLKLF
jgi:hypothetical protein